MGDKVKKILIIDDDPSIYREIQKRFENFQGLNFYYSSDGNIAIKMIGEQQPTVILLDMILPCKNGSQILENIQSTKEFKNYSIIVYSNLDDIEKIHEAFKLGVDNYYLKSDYGFNEIAMVLNKYINQ